MLGRAVPGQLGKAGHDAAWTEGLPWTGPECHLQSLCLGRLAARTIVGGGARGSPCIRSGRARGDSWGGLWMPERGDSFWEKAMKDGGQEQAEGEELSIEQRERWVKAIWKDLEWL